MKTYKATIALHLEEENPQAAARRAWALLTGKDALLPVVEIQDGANKHIVDLQALAEAYGDSFPVGTRVMATPKNWDFEHQFEGTVIGFRNGLIQVVDQNEDVFECDRDQLERLV